jgi:Kef-type K+ transport system membrane component KefB
VLSDIHAVNTREARVILGAAVFDDILGMIVLTIVAGLATGGSIRWIHMTVLALEAFAFAVFMILIGPRVVGRMRTGLERMSTHDAPLILALAICLGLSVLATKIGMAAIIGAFFAGLMFADYSPEWNLQPRVHAINEFLAPFFFFVMGARLDIHLFSAQVWKTAIIISLLAIISKVLGCGLPMLGEGMSTAVKVGVGMMPRGEVALIVALIGLQMNAISQPAYAVVIFMAGVTTLLAPPLLRYLFRHVEPEEGPPSELEKELRESSLG